ncbi:MAG TPA: gliding motility-associated C-terminal domain-containing protein [Saprospiraceae bacterium]|nr:gliding motility-associated C-terminal domain-containing protein [Saprospiraceae bacterium]
MVQCLPIWIFSILFCNTQWKGGPITTSNVNVNESALVCNLQVNAGPDVTICEPGDHIFLDGSILGDYSVFEWTPHTGLSNPYILDPSADVDDPITYTLTAWAFDPGFQNLIFNSDFNLGNTGFFTAYSYVMDQPVIQNEMYTAGTYTVVNDPALVNDNWTCDPNNPGSGGNMLLINGVSPLDTFWCQTINVNPNTQYQFSGWMLEVVQELLPDLLYTFNGETFGPVWFGANTCQWIEFVPANWFSGNATSVEICVICVNFWGGQSPLDIAFDDFSFVELCPVADSVSIFLTDDVAPEPDINGPADVCEGSTEIYVANFPAGTEILSYSWTISPGGVITSGQGTEQLTVHWNNTGIVNVCLTINTFCHSNSACFEVEINDVPPQVQITGPVFLCPGQTTSLVVPISSPGDEYQWSVPSGINIEGGEGSNSLEIQWGNLDEATICVDVSNECGISSACIDITSFPGYMTNMDVVLCEGEVIIINGNEYGNGNFSGTELFITDSGCDSLVEIQITQEFPVENMVTVMLCPGDSIFLEGAYQTQTGFYLDSFATAHACDSFVITQLILSFSDTTWISSTTCDTALAGTTITAFSVGNCDSIVVDLVSWVQSDTTILSLFSCNQSDTGQTVLILSNQDGCDSFILTHTFFIAPDSILISTSTCDTATAGITTQVFTNSQGCDSVVINTIFYQLSDTILISISTCTYSDTGTTSALYSNVMGCDSLVLTHHFFAGGDTTFLFTSTCSILDSGVFITPLINQFGCDSMIISNVYFAGADTLYLFDTTCDPTATGVFVESLLNQFGCDSIVTTTISYSISDFTNINTITCNSSSAGVFVDSMTNQSGCDSIVTLTVLLIPADTTILSFRTCDPAQVGSIQNTFTNQDGCDSLVIEQTSMYPLPDLQILITSDFNGFDISCFGEADGSVIANVGGIPPYSFIWSTGDTDPSITGLAAGLYAVTITDGNGCKTDAEVALIDPGPFAISFFVSQPDCFDQKNGNITVEQSGGIAPFRYSIDGINYQSSPSFNELSGGAYQFTVLDANECEAKEIVLINVPLHIDVSLGDDRYIGNGDTAIINAIVNVPFDSLVSIIWSGLSNPNCPACLTQPVVPIITSTYTVSVTSVDGCSDEDTMTLFLDKNIDVYVPNIFSPNGDNVNDKLLISGGNDVKEISSLSVFDRWGNLVYTADHFPPNDVNYAWDGTWNGRVLNSGVFAYKLIVALKDGTQVIKVGDVTLLR